MPLAANMGRRPHGERVVSAIRDTKGQPLKRETHRTGNRYSLTGSWAPVPTSR